MIKLFSLKDQKKDGTDGGSKTGLGSKKSSAAQLRVTKGLYTSSCQDFTVKPIFRH